MVRGVSGPRPARASAVDSGWDAVLAAGGEVGRLMRTTDWSATALGPMHEWKQSLRSALSICLASRFPIVMYWGDDLTVLYNDAYSRILGDKHPWALGKPCSVCWAEIWDTIGPMLNNVVSTGEATWSDDLLLVLERHGLPEECYFSFSFSPVRVETGAVGGVFTAVVETTHRVVSEGRLRILSQIADRAVGARSAEEACERCAEGIGSTPSVPFALIYLLGGNGSWRLVAGTGLPEDSELRDPGRWSQALEPAHAGHPAVVDLEAPQARPAAEWPLGIAPRQAVVMPIGHKDAGGASGFVVAGINPLKPFDGEYRSFVELLADQVSGAVTDAHAYEAQRRRAEALAELDRAKTEFFSNVSHEFRTPLTLILGPVESLLAEAQPGSRQAADLEVAHRNALRLLKLVNTLLDFARIDVMRREVRFEPVDLGQYTAELAGVFRSAIERAGLRLVVDCPPTAEPVYIDTEMWETVVLNLLSNALKFTAEGEIAVRVDQKDGLAELTVSDTGCGIAADALPHIFDRFYRVREADSRTHEGAGIGLALVRELVEIMGGTAEVSSAPGEGTTFKIHLKLGAAHLDRTHIAQAGPRSGSAFRQSTYVAETAGWSDRAVPLSSREPPSADTSRRLVLLVDDNADMRAYLERLLSEHWEVETATDGAVALDAIHRRRPDLIVTDVMMPGVDGFALVDALRGDERTRDVPVLMLSARAGEESAVEGLARGADDYLIKPFSAQEVIARVGANLRLAEMRSQLATARAEVALAAERNAFLNMAAHELRTPLTVIGGYVDLILSGAVEWGSPSARQALEKVAAKTKEGVRVVNQMLMAARMESGSIQVHGKLVDLRDLATAAIDRSVGLSGTESGRLVTVMPEAPVPVLADAELIAVILDNLLGNALVHGGAPVKVEVVASPPRVRVADQGPGIADGLRERIFEPFFRADHSLRAAAGVGLGLPVSRRLAELHGGSLMLERSTGGATFVLTLPSAAHATGSEPQSGRPEPSPSVPLTPAV